MSEFLGLAYFAEVPTVLIDVQRAGPSTGMPTRTQQADILSAAYASHGDTKQVLLFPSTPKECFDLAADAFDLAERLQTPIILMTDLDLGMNDNMSAPLVWDDERRYDRGKVLTVEDLEKLEVFGRYQDVDMDALCYRTVPGAHPNKGAFVTRGTSRDELAQYTENGEAYERNMLRLMAKWETAKQYVPGPEITPAARETAYGVIFFGTSEPSSREALDYLAEEGLHLDAMRVRAFPFNETVEQFIDSHTFTFVIEQNRDAQLRTLLMAEFEFGPDKLKSVLCFDGTPISARNIRKQILQQIPGSNVTPLRRETAHGNAAVGRGQGGAPADAAPGVVAPGVVAPGVVAPGDQNGTIRGSGGDSQ
jgi:2-oxoglutarate ferredoxin oxidoreductase subunit alpha